jgi:hypothetical protein
MSVPKYEMITSHTGRRTYITLCLEQGIRLDYLMSTTGHKKLDTMKKYTKIPHKRVGMEFIEKVKEKPQQEPIKKTMLTTDQLIEKLQENHKDL